MTEKNIVLIGMSGCGKTTIGMAAAARLKRIFIDTDVMVEEAEGISISELFRAKGEKYFRQCEARACADAAAMRGAVIATGGGAVLNGRNIDLLKATGIIVYIERDISLILGADAEKRPLFISERHVRELYEARLPLYKRYADMTLINNDDPQITADRLLDLLEEYGG